MNWLRVWRFARGLFDSDTAGQLPVNDVFTRLHNVFLVDGVVKRRDGAIDWPDIGTDGSEAPDGFPEIDGTGFGAPLQALKGWGDVAAKRYVFAVTDGKVAMETVEAGTKTWRKLNDTTPFSSRTKTDIVSYYDRVFFNDSPFDIWQFDAFAFSGSGYRDAGTCEVNFVGDRLLFRAPTTFTPLYHDKKDISAASISSSSFTITDAYAYMFEAGDIVIVEDSDNIDGNYTVVTSTQSGSDVVLVVDETVPSEDGDLGTLKQQYRVKINSETTNVEGKAIWDSLVEIGFVGADTESVTYPVNTDNSETPDFSFCRQIGDSYIAIEDATHSRGKGMVYLVQFDRNFTARRFYGLPVDVEGRIHLKNFGYVGNVVYIFCCDHVVYEVDVDSGAVAERTDGEFGYIEAPEVTDFDRAGTEYEGKLYTIDIGTDYVPRSNGSASPRDENIVVGVVTKRLKETLTGSTASKWHSDPAGTDYLAAKVDHYFPLPVDEEAGEEGDFYAEIPYYKGGATDRTWYSNGTLQDLDLEYFDEDDWLTSGGARKKIKTAYRSHRCANVAIAQNASGAVTLRKAYVLAALRNADGELYNVAQPSVYLLGKTGMHNWHSGLYWSQATMSWLWSAYGPDQTMIAYPGTASPNYNLRISMWDIVNATRPSRTFLVDMSGPKLLAQSTSPYTGQPSDLVAPFASQATHMSRITSNTRWRIDNLNVNQPGFDPDWLVGKTVRVNNICGKVTYNFYNAEQGPWVWNEFTGARDCTVVSATENSITVDFTLSTGICIYNGVYKYFWECPEWDAVATLEVPPSAWSNTDVVTITREFNMPSDSDSEYTGVAIASPSYLDGQGTYPRFFVYNVADPDDSDFVGARLSPLYAGGYPAGWQPTWDTSTLFLPSFYKYNLPGFFEIIYRQIGVAGSSGLNYFRRLGALKSPTQRIVEATEAIPVPIAVGKILRYSMVAVFYDDTETAMSPFSDPATIPDLGAQDAAVEVGGVNLLNYQGSSIHLAADIQYIRLYRSTYNEAISSWGEPSLIEVFAKNEQDEFVSQTQPSNAPGIFVDTDGSPAYSPYSEVNAVRYAASKILLHKGRLVIIGDLNAENSSVVRYSSLDLADSIAPTNLREIESGDGEALVAGASESDYLYLFKATKTYVIPGDVFDASPVNIDLSNGTRWKNLVCQYGGAVYFVNETGIWMITGMKISEVTREGRIRDLFNSKLSESIDFSTINLCGFSHVDHTSGDIYLFLPLRDSGKTQLDANYVIIYNARQDYLRTYSFRESVSAAATVQDVETGEFVTLIAGVSGKVYQFSADKNDAGASIDWFFRLKENAGESNLIKKSMRCIKVSGKYFNDLYVKYWIDGQEYEGNVNIRDQASGQCDAWVDLWQAGASSRIEVEVSGSGPNEDSTEVNEVLIGYETLGGLR